MSAGREYVHVHIVTIIHVHVCAQCMHIYTCTSIIKMYAIRVYTVYMYLRGYNEECVLGLETLYGLGHVSTVHIGHIVHSWPTLAVGLQGLCHHVGTLQGGGTFSIKKLVYISTSVILHCIAYMYICTCTCIELYVQYLRHSLTRSDPPMPMLTTSVILSPE